MSDSSPHPLGRVLLTGATGMVGSAVLGALLNADDVVEVRSLGRRQTGQTHPKLTEITFDAFGTSDQWQPHLGGVDTVFHCLATYSSRVSRTEYETITVAWLRALLEAAEAETPLATFCLFSAQGARPDGGGPSFALRIKGQAETALFNASLARRFAFRPGYIAPSGPRSSWKLADHLFVPIQRLMPSIGVTADELASAMLDTARHDPRQDAVLENGEIRQRLAPH